MHFVIKYEQRLIEIDLRLFLPKQGPRPITFSLISFFKLNKHLVSVGTTSSDNSTKSQFYAAVIKLSATCILRRFRSIRMCSHGNSVLYKG